ncbi:MAG: cytochrome c-type biogenesis protein [Pseudomonadota bacterium]
MKRLAVILALLAAPLWAVQPDEVLDDPELEARARALSAELRCLVCQNESIDESNASLARDLRLLVRERLVLGETDEEVMDFIVARYGEFVLLRPTLTGGNWLLYAAGPLMLLLALGIGYGFVRTRSTARPEEGLSDVEEARLREILDK